MQQRVRGLVGRAWAAGYLDEITGEGLSLALAQAFALRETVVPILREGSGIVTRQALARYESASKALAKGTGGGAGALTEPLPGTLQTYDPRAGTG